MDLTAAQWQRLSPLLPKPRRGSDGRSRPWRDPQDVLNGILWVRRTGAPWHHLPPRYPPYQTCSTLGSTLARVLHHLACELADAGGYDFTQTFLDATFAGAK